MYVYPYIAVCYVFKYHMWLWSHKSICSNRDIYRHRYTFTLCLKFHIVLHVSFVVAHLFLNITLLIPIRNITHTVVLHIESCI